MKVKLEEGYKDKYTISDLERAKRVINYEKEDDETAKGWAEIAIREALKNSDDFLARVLEASAETARNGRIWNAYDDDSGNMDVWITAIAKTFDGFIEVSAYLSDIWETGAKDYRDQMYIKRYLKA